MTVDNQIVEVLEKYNAACKAFGISPFAFKATTRFSTNEGAANVGILEVSYNTPRHGFPPNSKSLFTALGLEFSGKRFCGESSNKHIETYSIGGTGDTAISPEQLCKILDRAIEKAPSRRIG